MSDHDRGAYTPPTDEPLSFDPRFDARAPTGRDRPLPLTLIASGVVLGVLILAVFLFYRSGVRGSEDAPQPVGESIEVLKSAPADDAQPVQDEAAQLEVYAEDSTPVETAPAFAPPPEQPIERPQPRTPTPTIDSVLAGASAPTAAPAPATAAPAPAPKAPAVKAPAAAAPTTAAVGSASVQIGAFSNVAQADSGYADAIAATGASGKSKSIEAVERDGRTLYRTTVNGFASRAEAQAFCATLKARGGNCFVR
jgi:cytoskeletal protein RodZ